MRLPSVMNRFSGHGMAASNSPFYTTIHASVPSQPLSESAIRSGTMAKTAFHPDDFLGRLLREAGTGAAAAANDDEFLQSRTA